MDNMIFVVNGETGEYDDYATWPVAAYTDPEMANRHMTAANERVKEIEVEARHRGIHIRSAWAWLRERMGELDPNFDMDYNGTEYYVASVPLRVTPPNEVL